MCLLPSTHVRPEEIMRGEINLKLRSTPAVASSILVVCVLLAAPGVAHAGACAVTSLADSGAGTLREKVADINCTSISFAPGTVPGTIALSEPIEITRDLSLTGPGADKMT